MVGSSSSSSSGGGGKASANSGPFRGLDWALPALATLVLRDGVTEVRGFLKGSASELSSKADSFVFRHQGGWVVVVLIGADSRISIFFSLAHVKSHTDVSITCFPVFACLAVLKISIR